jgi:hypothetical protein
VGFFARLQLALLDASDEDAALILAAFSPAEDTPAPDEVALRSALARAMPDMFAAPIDEPDTNGDSSFPHQAGKAETRQRPVNPGKQ